jgi:PAS domain-containing protein
VFLVDPQGNLLYYNEAAEPLLGHRFEETGEMCLAEWSSIFEPTDVSGAAIEADELPLVIALREHKPAHRSMWIRGRDGTRRFLEVTALPLLGQGGRFLGGLALFWEVAAP